MRRPIAAAITAAVLTVPLTASDTDAAEPIKFGRIQYDSPGKDTGSNRSLNAEWVTVKNTGARARTLTGWVIRDPVGHRFKFPVFKLRAETSVRIHTGRGIKDRNDLYWREGNYVWNNTGDRATLKNRVGKIKDRCRWGDGSGVTNC